MTEVRQPTSEEQVSLEAVTFTDELKRRPTRSPDYETENRALVKLTRALADSPGRVLQTLADTLVEVFQADSAGISLLSDDHESFVWSAIAGQWQPQVGGGTPRNFGPCGDVLDCDAPMLFKHPERRYPYLRPVLPSAEEWLVLPFHLNGEAVGTLWLIAHDDRRKFDAEDLRQLESVGQLASAAYQLRMRNEQFETLLGSSPMGVYLIDADFRVRQVNPAALPAFGNIPGLIGRDFAEVMRAVWPAQKANETIERFRHTLKTGEAHLVPEMTEIRADRQTLEYYEWQINRIPLSDGRHGVVCHFRDISERVLAQEKIRENEWRLRYATESARLTFVEIDLASGAASTPENFAAVMGYELTPASPGDGPAGARLLLEHVAPHDRPRVDVALQKFFGGNPAGTIDYQVLGDDRIARWIETRWSTVFGVDAQPLKSFATNLDITERKRAEERLRSNHDTFFHLIENAPFGVYVVDSQFQMCQASAVSLAVFGNVPPLVGRDFEEIVRAVWTDPFASEVLFRFRRTLETGEPYAAPSTTQLRRDVPGLESYDWKIQRITLPDGQFGVVCYFYDVTERKLAEDALRESDSFTRSIIKSSPDCIKVLDLEGKLLSMQSGQELLGIEDIAPFLNTSWIEFWDGEHRQAARAATETAAAGNVARFVGFFRTSRGEGKWWDVAISPILGSNAKPARLLAVSRDVTLRRQAELNMEFLESVSRELAQWTGGDEMMRMVGARVAAHLQLSICAFAEIDETAEQAVINHEWHLEGMPGLVGTHRLADFVGEEFLRAARAGEVIVVNDAAADPRTDPEKFASFKIASFLCVPLLRDGQWRFALCLYKAAAHEWPDDEIELTRELTVRIWTRMERLRSEAALRESEQRYRSLFSSMDQGYCNIEMIFDENAKPVDWRFLEVNPAFSKLSGLHDVVGKRMRELAPDHEAYWFETFGRVAQSGEAARFMNQAKSLQNRWFDLYAFKVGGPDSRTIAVLFTNITERRTAEHKLQEQALALVDQDRRKDEFLAMLGHELRNPLAPISNALQLLRLQENGTPLQLKARTIIERQVGQLNRLVDDLLEVSRITTGRVQLRQERIVVSGVVERALETVQPLIARHRHQLTVTLPTAPVWLYADAARLEQVLVNLLGNAAKYTEDGGRIGLTLKQEGDEAVLRVKDTGIGIDAPLLPRIFDLFTQAERSLDRSQGGLGIGLCLVQRLVELHGGTVTATSVVGQGSEFVVRLPVMLNPALPVPLPPGVAMTLPTDNSCRVLVIDDNVDVAESLAMLLTFSGHEARMAHDGRSALEAALEFRPDLVLLDIGLPGLSGFEVAKQIRREPTLAPIVLVAMTGYGLETDRQRSRDAGFDHHLVKPADYAEVEKILESISR